jgi:hypothetical protein
MSINLMDLLIPLKPGTPTIHGSNQREKQEIDAFSRRMPGERQAHTIVQFFDFFPISWNQKVVSDGSSTSMSVYHL